MVLKLFNRSLVFGDCDRCGRLWLFEGRRPRAQYQNMKAKYGVDLCEHCQTARLLGYYKYT